MSFAEQPSYPPTFIFPFVNLANSGPNNLPWFQYLMYRPLFWFGVNGSPELNPSLSVADPPVYSSDGRTAGVTLKDYRWSDGEHVTAEDVLFWMNMLHAEKASWADYSPGDIPDNVRSLTVDSATRLRFTFDRPYNEHWMTYNQLSQITPMPKAWDITSKGATPGSGGCMAAAYGTDDQACNRVYQYLSQQSGFNPENPSGPSKPPSTFAANPLWQVVDGPWRLTALDPSGDVTMKPNLSYSGPTRPHLKSFKELAFTSETAEYDALRTGRIDYGYLPVGDAHPTTNLSASDPQAGVGGYDLTPLPIWGIGYASYNFHSAGDGGAAGAIFSQLYFRQALQSLVDQPLYIRQIFKGWGVPTYGPVPVLPPNPYAAAGETANPYPYDPARASTLLAEHGWAVRPGSTSYCQRAGNSTDECGPGVPAGARLDLELAYVAGSAETSALVSAETSSWRQAGITVKPVPESSDVLSQQDTPCQQGPKCTWEMILNGWIYSPDYYPSGEALFATGAAANEGSYSDPVNDANIAATYRGGKPLTTYEDYLASQLPVIWQPTAIAVLQEIRTTLRGATPLNPLVAITPEDWNFSR